MSSITAIPITLSGKTLGERHRHFNSLVNDAYRQQVPLQSILTLPESSPADRLFKIDVAAKHRNVEYILKSFQDDDMLFVSRALKTIWLLESQYREIINPNYLEDVLYPKMLASAVCKMKHWLQLHLKDERCEEFYLYYLTRNFEVAIKFLYKCSTHFILSNAKDILEKITPRHFKLLIEKCPEFAKLYFDSLNDNDKVVRKFLENERSFFNALKVVLKLNGDIVLDITEKYFLHRFSPEATHFIMCNHRDRFDRKPELYTAWFLTMDSLAKHLNKDEVKELLIQLAKAKYLESWYSYKSVEPLIKRLDVGERTAIKNQLFVTKSFGDIVENWPYERPQLPTLDNVKTEPHIFEDNEPLSRNGFPKFNRLIKKRKYCAYAENCEIAFSCQMPRCMPMKTPLDQLFDTYRFTSFEKTLYELRSKISTQSMQGRQNIMLVLISKSGGRPDSLEELFELLIPKHENEPDHFRATVIRSMVRRSCAWRWPENIWELFLKFGHDLGLDGRPSLVSCSEGLHAVVLRSLLLDQQLNESVKRAFLENFSTLTEYKLTSKEKCVIKEKLAEFLLSTAKADLKEAPQRLDQFLSTIDGYKIRVHEIDGAVPTIVNIARRCKDENLFDVLFERRIARRELLRENFEFKQSEESYRNALKHDSDLLSSGEKFQEMVKSGHFKHERFLRTMLSYFYEPNGLAEKYQALSEKQVIEFQDKRFARPLAMLSGVKILDLIQKLESAEVRKSTQLAALKANAHLARTTFDINTDWKTVGMTSIAARVLNCRLQDIGANIDTLISLGYYKLSLLLSFRVGREIDVLETVGQKKTNLALEIGLRYAQKGKIKDPRLWDVIMRLIANKPLCTKINKRMESSLNEVEIVPKDRKPEYCVLVYDIYKRQPRGICFDDLSSIFCTMLSLIDNIEEKSIENVIKYFLEEFTKELQTMKMDLNIIPERIVLNEFIPVQIIARYLLLSKSTMIQDQKLQNVGVKFFDTLEKYWESKIDENFKINAIDTFISALKYTKVFLNPEYVCCMPVFERTLAFMRKQMPLHLHFNKYVRLHLTMLYYKSIRQSITNNPDVFCDEQRKLDEGVEIIGVMFGKFIANEALVFASTYFDSITGLYQVELIQYLSSYMYCSSRHKLITCVIKGILSMGDSRTHCMTVYIYSKMKSNLPPEESKALFEMLNNVDCKELKFFLFADMAKVIL